MPDVQMRMMEAKTAEGPSTSGGESLRYHHGRGSGGGKGMYSPVGQSC